MKNKQHLGSSHPISYSFCKERLPVIRHGENPFWRLLATFFFFMFAYVFHDYLLYYHPGVWGKTGLDPPALSQRQESFPWTSLLYRDNWKWPHSYISQLYQHTQVSPTKSHGLLCVCSVLNVPFLALLYQVQVILVPDFLRSGSQVSKSLKENISSRTRFSKT